MQKFSEKQQESQLLIMLEEKKFDPNTAAKHE